MYFCKMPLENWLFDPTFTLLGIAWWLSDSIAESRIESMMSHYIASCKTWKLEREMFGKMIEKNV